MEALKAASSRKTSQVEPSQEKLMRTLSNWFIRSLITLMCVLGLSVLTSRYAIAQSGITELVPAGPTMPPVVPGASPWGGGVNLAASFLGWVSDYGLRSNIDSKISELKPKIDAAMPVKGGVLIVIGIQQSAQPDVNGNYVRWVLDGYIGGTGTTPKEAMEKYLSEDRLEQDASRGFVRRNVYLWKAAPVATLAMAQTAQQTAPTPKVKVGTQLTAPADEKQQVLDLSKEWVAAEIKHDANTLRRILDNKFVASFGAEKPYDKEAFIKLILTGEVDPTESQTLTDETVVIDQDTAVEVGTDTQRGTERSYSLRSMRNLNTFPQVFPQELSVTSQNGDFIAICH